MPSFRWLFNSTSNAIEYMFNGEIFTFAPEEYKPLPFDAADHLLHHLGPRGLVERAPEIPTVKAVSETYVCEICGKDFVDAAKPAFSLKQHRAWHEREAGHADAVAAASE